MHIDMPTLVDIERIATARDPLSVTIYLPTSPVPVDYDHNLLTARALINTALEKIQHSDAAGYEKVEEQLLSLLDDSSFWSDLGRSLAIFVTPAGVVEYRLPNQLQEYVSVSDRFAITPLLRATTFPQAAFVLALSQNKVRLIEISADIEPQDIPVVGLPENAESVVGLRSLGGRSHYGRIHGDEGKKVRLAQYARAVDHALRPVLNGESLPLILAAAEPLASIYRNLNGYAHLAQDRINGNPDELSDTQIAQAARGVLDDLYKAELVQLRETFLTRREAGRAATDLSDLAMASGFGAIDTLIVDMDAEVAGSVSDEGVLTLGSDTGHDAIEEITRRALATGARVVAVRRSDLPVDVAAAGILRFAI